jgi:hypothetical protein
MPRFFFHVVHRCGWGRDREGTDLPDLHHAHIHAQRLLLEARACFKDIGPGSRWLIQVTDEEESSKLTVLFPAALAAGEPHAAIGPPRATEVQRGG